MGIQSIRKTFSTRMMEQNTHDKIRASILGHSTPRVTNSNYSTVLTDIASKEMNRMNDQLTGKPKSKSFIKIPTATNIRFARIIGIKTAMIIRISAVSWDIRLRAGKV